MKCNYTFDHYKSILVRALKKGYKFYTCIDYLNNKPNHDKIFIMRHDVDDHIIRAFQMAKIENELNIKSTYFFRVFSNNYNVFSYENFSIIRDIESMGHEIGYHAEPVDFGESSNISYAQAFNIGKQALELVTENKIQGAASHREATGYNNLTEFISFHKPEDLGLKYEAYDNTNLDLFENSTYVTDGYEWYWRLFKGGKLTAEKKCVCEYIEKEDKLIYCLTHPNSWYKHHYHRVNY